MPAVPYRGPAGNFYWYDIVLEQQNRPNISCANFKTSLLTLMSRDDTNHFSLYRTVYRFEVWLPFARYLGFLSRNPLRSNSLIALFTVLRDKPRSEAFVWRKLLLLKGLIALPSSTLFLTLWLKTVIWDSVRVWEVNWAGRPEPLKSLSLCDFNLT